MFIFHSYRSSWELKKRIYDAEIPDASEVTDQKQVNEDAKAIEDAKAVDDFNFDFDFDDLFFKWKKLDRKIPGPIETREPVQYAGNELKLNIETIVGELNLDGNQAENTEEEMAITQTITGVLQEFDAVMEHNLQVVRVEYSTESKKFKRIEKWIQKQYESVIFQATTRILQANIEDATPEMQYKAKVNLITDKKYVGADAEITKLLLKKDPSLLEEVFEPLPKNEKELKRRLFKAIERRDLKQIVRENKENNPYTKNRGQFLEDKAYFSDQIQQSIDNIDGDVSTAYTDGIGAKNKEKLASLLAKEYNLVKGENGETYVQNVDGITWTLDYFETVKLPKICEDEYGTKGKFKGKRKRIRQRRAHAKKTYNELMGVPLVGLWSKTDMARSRNLKNNSTLSKFVTDSLKREENAKHPIGSLENEEYDEEGASEADTTQEGDVFPFGEVTPDQATEELTPKQEKEKAVREAKVALKAASESPNGFENIKGILEALGELINTLESKEGGGYYDNGTMELEEVTNGIKRNEDVIRVKEESYNSYQTLLKEKNLTPNDILNSHKDIVKAVNPNFGSQFLRAVQEFSGLEGVDWNIEGFYGEPEKEGDVMWLKKGEMEMIFMGTEEKAGESVYLFQNEEGDSFEVPMEGDSKDSLKNLGKVAEEAEKAIKAAKKTEKADTKKTQ